MKSVLRNRYSVFKISIQFSILKTSKRAVLEKPKISDGKVKCVTGHRVLYAGLPNERL